MPKSFNNSPKGNTCQVERHHTGGRGGANRCPQATGSQYLAATPRSNYTNADLRQSHSIPFPQM